MTIWIVAALVMLAALGLLLFLLSLPDRREPCDRCRPAPPTYRPPVAPPQRQDRLGLPPGEEGHLMAAVALHEATGMYVEACEDRARRRAW